jgi:uncharacterized protein YbaR (Trm112 family)
MVSERNTCPLCRKRIFDLTAAENDICFSIELICPNCRNIVRVNHGIEKRLNRIKSLQNT